MVRHNNDPEHLNDTAEKEGSFFEGSAFKVISGILVAAGILYGLATGFDFSGRVPPPNAQVSPTFSKESAWSTDDLPRRPPPAVRRSGTPPRDQN